MREVVLLMSNRAAQAFAAQIGRLQRRYGTESVVDTVRRALDEAEAADVPGAIDLLERQPCNCVDARGRWGSRSPLPLKVECIRCEALVRLGGDPMAKP